MIEVALLKAEIRTIKARIAKADRRLIANKAPESEAHRKDRLNHILYKKEVRVEKLLAGEEV
jgi:hypothetical protein